MTYKDYYKILGIPRTATQEDVKQAYRKLALKYHPDRNKGDKHAEERFKEINEANQVLGDPEKRKKYDQFGEDWKHYQESGARPGGFDWSKYAGGTTETRHMSQEEFDQVFGDEGIGDIFDLLFGRRSGQERGRRSAATKGADLETETTLSLEEAYTGSARLVRIDRQTIRIAIKPGIEDGRVLRIPGKGSSGRGGGPHGDLYLTVRIMPHPDFHRNGNDLDVDLPVDLYTAVLGGKTRVKTLKGDVYMDVPKGTQSGAVLRLRGLGMPLYGRRNEFGNLFVRIVIRIPDHLTDEELDLFKKLASLRVSPGSHGS